MNCTPWTEPQWYAKLCVGKNGRRRLRWSPDEKVVLKATSTLAPERNNKKIYWQVIWWYDDQGLRHLQKGTYLYLKELPLLRVSSQPHKPSSHEASNPQTSGDNSGQCTRTRTAFKTNKEHDRFGGIWSFRSRDFLGLQINVYTFITGSSKKEG